MITKFAIKAFIILILLLPLFSCGELDTVFPSSGGYQVYILVNGNTLEDCPLIRTEDQIRPYFAVSVINDPDLTGLLVYLRNSQGFLAGEKVRYVLNPLLEDEEDSIPSAEEDEDGFAADFELSGPREKRSLGDADSVKNTEIVIEVKSFDRDLPFFPMPEGLAVDTYSLVFEALGGKNILSRTETKIFYLGDTVFNLKDVSMYLPGVSSSRLICPGTTVMLEARLDYDDTLDPYVIWYSGKNIVSEGKFLDGAGSILWKVSEQAGFYPFRAEIFPFNLSQNISGMSREIVLPVSPKAGNTGYFFENNHGFAPDNPLAQGTVFSVQAAATSEEDMAEAASALDILPDPPRLLHLYQFSGNLNDSMFASLSERDLILQSETYPKWAAVDQSFGLSTGPDDIYILPPFTLFNKDEEEGGGIFLLHFRPSAEGVIFGAFFPFLTSSSQGVTVELSRRESAIVLQLSSEGENDVELTVYSDSNSLQSYIPVAVEFFARSYRLEAKLTLGEPPFSQSVVKSIGLRDEIVGEGKIWLGGQAVENKNNAIAKAPAEKPVQEDVAIDALQGIDKDVSEPADTKEEDLPATAIWNEFAVLYSSMPLLPEEILPADSESEELSDEAGDQDPTEEIHAPEDAVMPAITDDPPEEVETDEVPQEQEDETEDDSEYPDEDSPDDSVSDPEEPDFIPETHVENQ